MSLQEAPRAASRHQVASRQCPLVVLRCLGRPGPRYNHMPVDASSNPSAAPHSRVRNMSLMHCSQSEMAHTASTSHWKCTLKPCCTRTPPRSETQRRPFQAKRSWGPLPCALSSLARVQRLRRWAGLKPALPVLALFNATCRSTCNELALWNWILRHLPPRRGVAIPAAMGCYAFHRATCNPCAAKAAPERTCLGPLRRLPSSQLRPEASEAKDDQRWSNCC